MSIEAGPEGADVELVQVRDVRQKLACSWPDPETKIKHYFASSVTRVADPDPHLSEKPDPDPHSSPYIQEL